MRKVVAVIQARTTSERLPQKVLANLKGKAVLEHVFLAVRSAVLVDEIILATTTNKEDDILTEIAASYNIPVVRGSEDDVLSRFAQAAEITDADTFIRFTADDPLLDPTVINTVVGYFLKNDYDYVSNIIDRSWPRGLDTEVFSRKALMRCIELGQATEHKEHVTLFIRMHPELFPQANVAALPEECLPEARLCIDTVEDYQLLQAIFDKFYQEGQIIKVVDVVRWLKENDNMMNLNASVIQKSVFGKIF